MLAALEPHFSSDGEIKTANKMKNNDKKKKPQPRTDLNERSHSCKP